MFLLYRWKQKQLTNGLLILDDVCNKEIVKYLDIGCKMLITTHDKSIMDNIVDTRVNYIKVNEGFEEKETLDLFSKCLNVSYLSLPPCASKLHKICKGNIIISNSVYVCIYMYIKVYNIIILFRISINYFTDRHTT